VTGRHRPRRARWWDRNGSGDTLRWHGVVRGHHGPAGMTIAELAEFITAVRAEAEAAGADISGLIPLVTLRRRCAIRHIWVPIRRRREHLADLDESEVTVRRA
jgi:hypothetical protein